MEFILAWQNLVFLVPLGLGLVSSLVAAAGIGGESHDFHHDAHFHTSVDTHDVGDSHAGGHSHAAGHWPVVVHAAEILGIGKAPLTTLFSILFLNFGAIGFISNALLSPVLRIPVIYGCVSLLTATVGSVFFTGRIARLVVRYLPASETYLVSKKDLVECRAVTTLPTDENSGLAILHDREGNVHNVSCRSTAGRIPKGTEVLTVEYDELKDEYLVTPIPDEGPNGAA